MSGFALVQLLPGPLFNIAAYIGGVHMGWQGALVAWLGLNGPALLLVIAFLPLWDRLRRVRAVSIFLQGVNCAALGLIFSVGVSLYMQVRRVRAALGPNFSTSRVCVSWILLRPGRL